MRRPARQHRHWRTIVTTLLVPLLILSTSGCATMFNPAFQEVPVASTPEGAEVWIDGEFIGTTPVTVRLRANEDHEVMVRFGEEENVWLLQRRVGTTGGAGIAGDVLIAVPLVLVGGGLAIALSQPCSGGFDFFCGDPSGAAVGVGIAAVGLVPVIVDVATNQFYELVPKEITAEF